MSKRKTSNAQMLNEIKKMQALIVNDSAKNTLTQIETTELVWKHITGLQTLFFRYESGMWEVQQLKSSGEFSMTLAIGILAVGIALLSWPFYLLSAAMFGLSYYYLFKVNTETRKWEMDVAREARALIERTGQS